MKVGIRFLNLWHSAVLNPLQSAAWILNP
jgi:hypothetical protein